MDQRFDSIEFHVLERPSNGSENRLLHESPPLCRLRQLKPDGAASPRTIPFEETAGADELCGVAVLNPPANSRSGRLTPTGKQRDQLLRLMRRGQWIGAEPFHRLCVAMNRKQSAG